MAKLVAGIWTLVTRPAKLHLRERNCGCGQDGSCNDEGDEIHGGALQLGVAAAHTGDLDPLESREVSPPGAGANGGDARALAGEELLLEHGVRAGAAQGDPTSGRAKSDGAPCVAAPAEDS